MNLPDFVTHLPPDQKKHWEAKPSPVTEKQVIVSPDMPSNTDVFYVVKGEFEVTTFSEKGKIVFYRLISPGDVFGELAAIDGRERAATVTSLGDGLLVQISGADFKQMVETSPEVGAWLVRRHTALIRSLTKKLYQQIAYDVATRILAELIELAERTKPTSNRVQISQFPPHHALATRLGTTREAVTRELNFLGPKESDPTDPDPKGGGRKPKKPRKTKKGEKKENLNLIEQKGRVLIIFDLAALKRLLKERTTVP